jgi:hypothetical protein
MPAGHSSGRAWGWWHDRAEPAIGGVEQNHIDVVVFWPLSPKSL